MIYFKSICQTLNTTGGSGNRVAEVKDYEAPRTYSTSLKVVSHLEGVACVVSPKWRSKIKKGGKIARPREKARGG